MWKHIRVNSVLLLIAFFAISTLQSQTNESLFFVFLNTNPDKPKISEEEIQELQKAHLDNIGKLAKEGIIKAAGPFDGGGGLFILSAESIDKVNSILQSDPAIKADRFKLEVYPLQLLVNAICGAKEPYEMVTYQFARLIPSDDNSVKIDLTKKENVKYFSKLNKDNNFLVVHGSFGDQGGMVILDVENPQQAEKVLNGYPFVIEGILNFEIKSLWIAKGTFCKK